MKNITVSVADEVYHRVRVRAAELRTSVSAMVQRHLEQVSQGETRHERLRRREEETLECIRRRGVAFRAANRLARDQTHDRNALR